MRRKLQLQRVERTSLFFNDMLRERNGFASSGSSAVKLWRKRRDNGTSVFMNRENLTCLTFSGTRAFFR